MDFESVFGSKATGVNSLDSDGEYVHTTGPRRGVEDIIDSMISPAIACCCFFPSSPTPSDITGGILKPTMAGSNQALCSSQQPEKLVSDDLDSSLANLVGSKWHFTGGYSNEFSLDWSGAHSSCSIVYIFN